MQEGAYLDFQEVISLKPKEIPSEYTASGGLHKDLSNRRKPLKIIDCQRFSVLCLYPKSPKFKLVDVPEEESSEEVGSLNSDAAVNDVHLHASLFID